MSQQRSQINLQDADLDVVFHNERSTARHGNVSIERHPRFVDQGPNLRPQIANAFTNYDSNVEMRDINSTLEYPANSGSNESNPDPSKLLRTVILDTTTNRTGDIYIRSTPVNEPFVAAKSPKIFIPQTSNHDVDERDARLFSPPILGELGKFTEIGIELDLIFRPTPEQLSRGDVFFNVAGDIFPAIQFNLSAKSVVFKALFEQTGVYGYKISQIDPEVFKLMLDFVNTGILNTHLIGQQKIQQLLQVAAKFELLALKERCEQALIDSPKCQENALNHLILAHACKADKLKESLTDFIAIHKWTIENFEHLFSCAEDKTPILSVVHSDTFPASDKLQFSIRLIPKYFDETDQIAYVSLFLYLKQCQLENKAISLYYEFSIINSKGEKLLHKDETKDFKQENSHGWDKFIRLDHLLDRSKGFLQNGNLTILCSVKIFANNLSTVTYSSLKKFSTQSRFNCDLKVNQVNRLWEIEQFSAFFYRTNDSIEKYFCVQSEKFSEKTFFTNKYYLRLWPKGIDEQSDGFVSIFLHCENFAQIDYAQYRLSILDRSGEFFHFGEGKIEFLRGQKSTTPLSQGSAKFLPIDSIFDPKNGLLPGDKLTIYCEIEEVIKSAQPSSSSRYSTQRSVYDQMDNIQSSFLRETLPQKDKFSEIGIEADLNSRCTPRGQGNVYFMVNGYEFTALRTNLYNRSVIFKSLFEQKPNTNRFVIKQVNREVFKTILDYLSDGNVGTLNSQLARFAREILKSAHKFAFDELKERCEDFLISKITMDNAIDLLLLAEECQAQKLKHDIIKFIVSDCPSIVETDDFARIAAANFILFHDLYEQVKDNKN